MWMKNFKCMVYFVTQRNFYEIIMEKCFGWYFYIFLCRKFQLITDKIFSYWCLLPTLYSNSNSQRLFSSPEHKVLMVSFCDRPMSGVCSASCVVHNFFKHLLLLNHSANLDETWQGCSFGDALPKLFKRLNSTHNSGCHGNQKEKNSKIFENLLLWK